MRAVGQQVPGKSNVLTPRNSEVVIPWKRVALYATISVAFFLLGFLPMWLDTTRASEQRDAAQRGVRLAQLQNTLAAAVIDVQRGEYEPARQLTSDFFTKLRHLIDRDTGSFVTRSQRDGLTSLLAERDELITLLTHRDPAATDRLFKVYAAYNKLANNSG